MYTPVRYLFHTLQMASAYGGQMARTSTITNCNWFQMADAFRCLSHTAYRTKELSLTLTDKGFNRDERACWENDAVVIKGWIAKWEPLADQAIAAYCAMLPDVPNAAASAQQATRDFRRSLDL